MAAPAPAPELSTALRIALERAVLPQLPGAADDPFAPIPRLDDILAPPTALPQYATKQDLDPPLQARLHRLWLERGDFSRFRRAALTLEGAPPAQPGPDASALFGIPSPPASPPAQHAPIGAPTPHGSVTIAAQDAEAVKTDMLHRIGNAHFATYFLHNLLALLLQHQTAQRKAELEHQSALAQAQLQIIPGNQAQARKQLSNRAGTPATDISDSATASQQAPAPTEPYFDPKILGLSEVFPDPHASTASGPADLDSDEEDDAPSATVPPKPGGSNQPGDAALPQPLEQTPFPALATQRANLSRASSLLRAGATSIRRVSGSALASSSSSSSTPLVSEAQRWAGLQHLRLASRQWHLAPAPQNVGVGSAVWWGGLSAREDGEGAGAKDAWIGYGLPEVQSRFRRGAMAYFADDDMAKAASATSTTQTESAAEDTGQQADKTSRTPSEGPLVFLHRPRRRLRVKLISTEGKEYSASDHPQSTQAADKAAAATAMASGDELQRVLREAQEELLDEELWSDLLLQVQNTPAVVVRASNPSSSSASSRPTRAGTAAGTPAPGAGGGGGAAAGAAPGTPQLRALGEAVLGTGAGEDGEAGVGGAKSKRKKRKGKARDASAAAQPESIEIRLGGGWTLLLEMSAHHPAAEESSDASSALSAVPQSSPTPADVLPRILLAYFRLSIFRSIRHRLAAAEASTTSSAAASAAPSGPTPGPTAASTAPTTATTTADRGKSLAQLEREAAASASRRGVGAYEVTSVPKSKARAGGQTSAAAGGAANAGVGGGEREKEKEAAGRTGVGAVHREEGSLDPVLGLFRYATFIADLERILDVARDAQGGRDEGHSDTLEKEKLWYRLAPLASLSDSGAWLHLLLDAAQRGTTGSGTKAGDGTQMDAVRLLSGTGTVFLGDEPLVLLDFGYPARLKVQFCRREVPRWSGELSLDVFRSFVEREMGATEKSPLAGQGTRM